MTDIITHSYIVSCLESYEVAKEQIRWLARILRDNWELIFVDDGSDPAIEIPAEQPANVTVLRTNDRRPWTQDLARNLAARAAQGAYLLMTDIDHVFTPEAIQGIEQFNGKMCQFPRQCGCFVDGEPQPVPIAANRVPPNIYLIRRNIFLELGGYDESLCNGHYYATDRAFLRRFEAAHGPIETAQTEIFVIPEECGTFHSLVRA